MVYRFFAMITTPFFLLLIAGYGAVVENPRLVRVGCAVLLLIPLNSAASAPMYVDLGGLGGVFLYLVGLLVFPFYLTASKGGKVSSLRCWLYFIYFVAPFAFFFVFVELDSRRKERTLAETEALKRMAFSKFEEYCKGRERVIHARAPHGSGASISVRIEKGFPGDGVHFNAQPIFEYLGARGNLCVAAGVAVLEGLYDGDYSQKTRRYDKEVRRYAVCSTGDWRVIPEAQSRYELVLGRTSRVDHYLLKNDSSYSMSRSSVQIVDRGTGKVLAEDMMYFFGSRSMRVGSCPEGMEQLSSLMADVFGSHNEIQTPDREPAGG